MGAHVSAHCGFLLVFDLMTIVEVLRDGGKARPLAFIGFIGAAQIVSSNECHGPYWDQGLEEPPPRPQCRHFATLGIPASMLRMILLQHSQHANHHFKAVRDPLCLAAVNYAARCRPSMILRSDRNDWGKRDRSNRVEG